MTNEALSFSLVREEQQVTIDNEPYVLVELDGGQRDQYLNDLGQRVKTNAAGKTEGVKSFDKLQANLVHSSLRKVEGDKRVPVPVATIQSWPSRVVSGLFDAAKKLSRLDPEEKEVKEGND